MQKNYYTNKDAMNIPWIESPFFKKLMEFNEREVPYTDDEWYDLIHFNEHGFIKIDLGLSEEFIQQYKESLGKNPCQIDGWKKNQNILDLAINTKVLDKLKFLYERNAFPFETVTSHISLNQPLYSNILMSNTMPKKWMATAWIALEDMSEDNGTLCYIPGSHKWPEYTLDDLGFSTEHPAMEKLKCYEHFMRQLVNANGNGIESLECKSGTAFIFASNLIYGSLPKAVEATSCWHQYNHYFFEGCDKYYSPIVSDLSKGIITSKDLSKRNILNYEIQ